MVMNKKEDEAVRGLLTIRCKHPTPERRHKTSELRPIAARSVACQARESGEIDAETRTIHVMRHGMMYRSLDGLRWTPETDPEVPPLPEGGVRITMEE
jgi:hypothetical protein